TTTIKYQIPHSSADGVKSETANVKLIVYDILGREVATLVNQKQSPGNYEVKFDARDFTSGIYFYKISSGSYTEVKKMILLK
ncbi:MAG: T9SS type A sorting domain-containing protein, partial [Ignavibacteriae bacterium]|nr:T9SS type A sorting domain-containing protein [Ignavibacteriota bacterium]